MLLKDLTCKVRCGGKSTIAVCACRCPRPVPKGRWEALLEDASLSPAVFNCPGLVKLVVGKEEEGILSFWKGHLCHVCRAASAAPPNLLTGGRTMATGTRQPLHVTRGAGGTAADKERDFFTAAGLAFPLAPTYLSGTMLV